MPRWHAEPARTRSFIGFVFQACNLVPVLSFQERYLRGGTDPGAAGVGDALAGAPEFSPASAVEGSGVLNPSAAVTFGDKVSLLATAHLPRGRSPRALGP